MGLYDYTIYSLIRRNARALGDRTALVCAEESISHREVLNRVDRLAGGLWKSGLRPGDRVAVLSMKICISWTSTAQRPHGTDRRPPQLAAECG